MDVKTLEDHLAVELAKAVGYECSRYASYYRWTRTEWGKRKVRAVQNHMVDITVDLKDGLLIVHNYAYGKVELSDPQLIAKVRKKLKDPLLCHAR